MLSAVAGMWSKDVSIGIDPLVCSLAGSNPLVDLAEPLANGSAGRGGIGTVDVDPWHLARDGLGEPSWTLRRLVLIDTDAEVGDGHHSFRAAISGAIIAALIGVTYPISAGSIRTTVEAVVQVALVTVVALLVSADEGVAACVFMFGAVGQAPIAVVIVAVVALFWPTHDRIATLVFVLGAISEAPIAVVGVSVVADLRAAD